MTAKEMFEELGYEFDDSLIDEINYFSKKFISDTFVINFNLREQTLECFIEYDSPFTPNRPYSLSIKELKAINKQVEELGWY